MPSLWSFFTLMFSWSFALILIKLSLGVLKAGIHYRTNQFFSLSLGFFALTIFFFPVGGFFEPVPIILTTKIYNYGEILALTCACWGAIIVYLGEENWNNPVTIIFSSIIAVVYLLSLLSPDSIVMTETTGTAMTNYQLILYGTVRNLLVIVPGILLIWSYRKAEHLDVLLRHQIKMLLIGFGLILSTNLPDFLAEYLNIHNFDRLSQLLYAGALLAISRAFKRDMSLNHLKLLSVLYRSRQLIKQGKIKQAGLTLIYAEKIAAIGNLRSVLIDILFIRAKLACVDFNFSQADPIIAELEQKIALMQVHDRTTELETLKREVKVYFTANGLYAQLENEESQPPIPSLDASLLYLDQMITKFQSEIAELHQK